MTGQSDVRIAIEKNFGPSSDDSAVARDARANAEALIGVGLDPEAWAMFFRRVRSARLKFMMESKTPAPARKRLERLAAAAAEFSAALNAMEFDRPLRQCIDAEVLFPEALGYYIYEASDWQFDDGQEAINTAIWLTKMIGDAAFAELADHPKCRRGEGAMIVGYVDFAASVNALWFHHRTDKALAKKAGRSSGRRAEFGLALEALIPRDMRRGTVERVGDALASIRKKYTSGI